MTISIKSFLFLSSFILVTKANADSPMTNPFSTYRIREVKFSGGVAGATSFYPNWQPEKGFTSQIPVDQGWHAGPGSGNAYSPPLILWYDFKTATGIQPAEVSLQPCQTGGGLQGAPSSYQFIGSNDAVCNDDATWTILCEDLSDRAWRSHWEVRYCKVKPEIHETFRCLGIRALANHRPDGWTSMRNVRMWEKVL
jgi:hypothetical protein